MGNCCDSKTKVNDQQGVTKLDNGEEVDLSHYNQPENLHKIQKIQAKVKDKKNQSNNNTPTNKGKK